MAPSACEVHRAWIEAQVSLGRNAVAIYQDLVEAHGFAHRYNSVKRFVAKLRARAPERFDVLEFAPGEEAQVDYGQGAPTRYKPGKYRRPYLFVMTLKYSGKSFRATVWKTDAQTWASLHEQAFRALGGVPRYVVLDNLREGVIGPDLYAPELNPHTAIRCGAADIDAGEKKTASASTAPSSLRTLPPLVTTSDERAGIIGPADDRQRLGRLFTNRAARPRACNKERSVAG